MGIWSGIKHALNSTLGTSNFKPLNTMIDETKSYLNTQISAAVSSISSTIDGQRTLAASDSVLKVLLSSNTLVNSSGKALGSFTPRKNGSVRILVNLYTTSGDTGRSLTVNILQGGNLVTSESVKAAGTSGTSVYYSLSLDMPVSANAPYEIYGVTNSSSVYVSELKVGAAIVDTSLIES